ncbi:hypothetical protein [Pseudomonas sp. SCB32]|uniref:hypothetical protein n=1 Tax=Pseudomonas sp. SCB32 TaxID=2653853 RepID=UPI00126472CB|nr:hypothetical protein [Pseudomonas sp. SCB32]
MNAPKDNPFKTPHASLLDNPPGKPLYRLAAVGIATFFGTPIAGAWVIVHNLRHLGRDDQVRNAWLMGFGLFVALSLIGWLLPDNVSAAPTTIAAVLGMYQYARHGTGDALEQHASRGGTFLSNWRAFGISLLCLLAIVVVAFIVSFIIVLGQRFA